MSKKNRLKREPRKTKVVSLSGDNSPYVFQRDKLDFELVIKELPWTEKQKSVIELISHKDTKVVFLNGPAGCSKSLLAVYCGLKLLNSKRVTELIYVRSIIESATRSLGSLPGESDEKFRPFAVPLIDKMDELLRDHDQKKLFADDRIKPIPINFLRGASFNVNMVIADEMQNAVYSEIQTIMTRMGQFSKLIICGDPAQSDLQTGKSGFMDVYNAFNSQESRDKGIYCVEFTEEDIMRSDICKYIVKRFTELKKQYLLAKEQQNTKKNSTVQAVATTSTLPSWSPQRD